MALLPTGAYIAVWVVFIGMATLSLAARLWVRLRILQRTLDWDDYFIIAAFLFMIGEETCLMNFLPLLIQINNNTSTIQTIVDLRRLMWIQFYTFTFAAWLIKFSLLAFYARLFYFAMKKTLWATGIFLIVTLAAVIISTAAQCVPAQAFWTPIGSQMENGVMVPVFACASDKKVQVINTMGVVISVISDFVVLALPIFRVIKLKINFRQKCALLGVFAIGTLVACIEVLRGAWVLAFGAVIDGLSLNLIWVTMQCTLGVVVTNLPILRPLLFRRSFTSSGDDGSRSGGRSWVQRTQNGKKGIPLYEVPEYRGHTSISGGGDYGIERHDNEILKSVEVRVESESIGSSTINGSGSKSFTTPF